MDEALREAISRWLAKAESDSAAAAALLATTPPLTDVACFHAQQCAEKALKAFLVFENVHVERTHYLPRLVALCSNIDPSFAVLRSDATELTDYAVETRYVDDWREIPLAEATEAVAKALQIKDFVKRKLSVDIGPDPTLFL